MKLKKYLYGIALTAPMAFYGMGRDNFETPIPEGYKLNFEVTRVGKTHSIKGILLSDINRDNALDVVTYTDQGDIYVFTKSHDDPPKFYENFIDTVDRLKGIIIADIDGDKQEDITAYNENGEIFAFTHKKNLELQE